jgi:phosphoribosylanthranilate isomerase
MTQVKICGLSTREMVDMAVAAGADFIGLVHFPKSPRHVGLATAGELARHAHATSGGRVRVVLLLVDPDDALLAEAIRLVPFDYLQLHGSETPERVRAIRTATGLPTIKAAKVATRADVEASLAYADAADLLLYDARPPAGATLPGGNGVPFDWRILEALPGDLPYMLSGGLTPDNVGPAVAATRAAMVDVSSGVETAPGIKDEGLVRRFVERAKAVDKAAKRR